MNALFGAIAMVVTFYTGRSIYRAMFEDREDFWHCLGISFTPDLLALLQGRYLENQMKSLKVGVFVTGSIGSGLLTWWVLDRLAG
ncbi:MAG: hypothetical protein EOP85_04950 [Verrucomicrobiaceae bacterium]|nr:MAG: hypothetical protein EOP85_04950 [Verrucomicrobiaceae bacterium]